MLPHFKKNYLNLDYENYERMTYIIAGIQNNIPFLMVDCISLNKEKKKSFSNKLIKLESSKNTYFTLTGNQLLSDAIRLYDNWLFSNNKINDFITGSDSIDSAIDFFLNKVIKKCSDKEKVKICKDNKIFFINSQNIVYFDLNFSNYKLIRKYKYLVNNSFTIDSFISSHQKSINNEIINIFDYCKNEIIQMSGNINFKDRFSFITFKDDIPDYRLPYKNLEDTLIEYYDLSFNEIV
jgi:hypothetical protein